MALIGHLQVANEIQGRVSDPDRRFEMLWPSAPKTHCGIEQCSFQIDTFST